MKLRYSILAALYFHCLPAFSQGAVKSASETRKVFLKTDTRAMLLQPGLSFDLILSKVVSLEAGSTYFWTGQKIYEDQLGDRFGQTFIGIGPSKGYDLYSDIKFSFRSGAYLGFGYLYRDSHYRNRKFYYEIGEYKYQHYRQTEQDYCNMVSITFGVNYEINDKLYGNPYAKLMIGNAKITYDIDTGGATTYVNYSPSVFPEYGMLTMPRALFQIGFKFSFDLAGIRAKRAKLTSSNQQS